MLNDDVKPKFQFRLVAPTCKVFGGNLAKHMEPTLVSPVHRSSYCLIPSSCSVSHHFPCWHSCTCRLCTWHHICPLRAAGTSFLTQLATCGSNTPSRHPITLCKQQALYRQGVGTCAQVMSGQRATIRVGPDGEMKSTVMTGSMTRLFWATLKGAQSLNKQAGEVKCLVTAGDLKRPVLVMLGAVQCLKCQTGEMSSPVLAGAAKMPTWVVLQEVLHRHRQVVLSPTCIWFRAGAWLWAKSTSQCQLFCSRLTAAEIMVTSCVLAVAMHQSVRNMHPSGSALTLIHLAG